MDKFLKEEVKIDQLHLMNQVFSSFCDDEEALILHSATGRSADVEYNVLPLMYDSAMAV